MGGHAGELDVGVGEVKKLQTEISAWNGYIDSSAMYVVILH